MSEMHVSTRPTALSILMIVAGVAGFTAAFALTLDKLAILQNPAFVPSCNLSLFFQCGVNLKSTQGSVFGFPNPLLGLGGYFGIVVVGVSALVGARFPRWYWVVFNLGVAFAFSFVCWLIWQSIFVLGTLCPWCMVVWSVTIPLFIAVTFYNLAVGNWPIAARAQRFFDGARSWVPLVTLGCYLTVAIAAVIRLPILAGI
jgi:uncharacterized membrane protein